MEKTAYEMPIVDWSSDVCSSDLGFLVRSFRREQRFCSGFGGTWKAAENLIQGTSGNETDRSRTGANRSGIRGNRRTKKRPRPKGDRSRPCSLRSQACLILHRRRPDEIGRAHV